MQNDQATFLNVKQVCARVGLSRTTVYMWAKAGQFPLAKALGPGRVAWLSTDIEAWMASRPSASAFDLRAPH